MDEERKACVVLIQHSDGSFGVLDAAGRLHQARDLAELGRACATVLEADDLPEVARPTALQIHVEAAAEKTVELLGRKAGVGARALAPLFAPAIKGVSNSIARLRRNSIANDRQQTRDADLKTQRVAQRKRLIATRGTGAA